MMETFFISFIGAIVAAGLVALISRYAPDAPRPAPRAEPELYSKPTRILLASSFAVAAWMTSVIFLLVAALGFAGVVSDSWFLGVLGISFCFGILYLCASLPLKCNHCTRRIFAQWTEEPPTYSVEFKGMKGGTAIVLQVLLTREFQCMNCGKQYRVSINA